MKLYTPINGSIKGLDESGYGILDTSGKPVKVRFGLPGDVLTITPTKRARGEFIADIVFVNNKSPFRVTPKCPYVDTCGGCLWQALDYPKQLECKRSLVNDAFAKTKLPYQVDALTPASEIFYYRNRMDFVFGPNGELGLKEPGRWFSYLDLSTCFLLSPKSVEVMQRVRDWVKLHNLLPYNTKSEQGFLRYLVIREGKNSGDRLVHLLTTSQATLPTDFADSLSDLATHILHGVNDSITDLSLADTSRVLKGSSDFTERANSIDYTIPFGSFFQTNTVMAEQLFNAVRQACAEASEVLDLYCGVGFFALGLAKLGIKTSGVEIDPNAIRAAKESALNNHLEGISFTVAKAEDVSWKASAADTVIIDPPRAGLHPRVIASLLEMRPKRIIYISCKYTRFIEELPKLLSHYQVKTLQAFDLFPHTPHLELLIVLDRITL